MFGSEVARMDYPANPLNLLLKVLVGFMSKDKINGKRLFKMQVKNGINATFTHCVILNRVTIAKTKRT
jgi:hypothetical protein